VIKTVGCMDFKCRFGFRGTVFQAVSGKFFISHKQAGSLFHKIVILILIMLYMQLFQCLALKKRLKK
jgi:hypothetical protein